MGLLQDGKTSSRVPPACCHCTQAADGHRPGDSSSQGMMQRSWQSRLERGAVRHRDPGRASTDVSQGHAPSFGALNLPPARRAALQTGGKAAGRGEQAAEGQWGGDTAGDVPRCWDVAVGDIGLLQGSQAPSRIFPSPAQCPEASSPSSSAIRGAGCTSITHSLAKERL